MISKQRCLFYFVGDKAFKTLEDAQKADLVNLIPTDFHTITNPDNFSESIANWLLDNSARIVDCLTTTPKSRLRARKAHGAVRKPRKPKATPPAPSA